MSLSSSWYQQVRTRLDSSGIFVRIEVIGAKVRAFIREELYVDIYYDPTTSSYSYALIDQTKLRLIQMYIMGSQSLPEPEFQFI